MNSWDWLKIKIAAVGAFLLLVTSCASVPQVATSKPHRSRNVVSSTVVARALWNDTGIDLKRGKTYRVQVDGTWRDLIVNCNEEGPLNPAWDLFFKPVEFLLRLKPTKTKPAEYFSLVGVIGSPSENDIVSHAFLIRNGMTINPNKSGRLYAFANDWKSAYSNNCGSLRIVIVE